MRNLLIKMNSVNIVMHNGYSKPIAAFSSKVGAEVFTLGHENETTIIELELDSLKRLYDDNGNILHTFQVIISKQLNVLTIYDIGLPFLFDPPEADYTSTISIINNKYQVRVFASNSDEAIKKAMKIIERYNS